MWPYFRPYKKTMIVAVLASVITASTNGGLAVAVKYIMDGIFLEKREDLLTFVPIAIIVIYLVKSVFLFLQNYLMAYVGNKVIEKIRNESFNKLMHLPLSFYSDKPTGELMSRITNDINLVQLSIPTFITIFRAVLTMIGLISVVIYMNWKLALMAIICYPIFIMPLKIVSTKLRKYGTRGQETMADMNSTLQEAFSGIRIVKAFTCEDKEYNKFKHVNAETIKYYNKGVFAGNLIAPLMEAVGSFGIAAILFFGGYQVINGYMTPGDFFAFLAAIIQIYEPVKLIGISNNGIQHSITASERIFSILNTKNPILLNNGTKTCDANGKNIEFKNVTFSYNDKTNALNNVSFKVKAGSTIAFVGPSGAGKSTMANLIPRFYDVSKGEITIDNINIKEFDVFSLRKNIATVSQDAFLFNDTIKNNIAYGNPNASMEDIINVAKAAYAHDFIEQLDNKYDTICGERGTKLSGGQKQRITIARALLQDAPILILDEATSALDTESERVVQKALDNLMKGRTSFIIAHRLSTIINADMIVVFSEGKIEAMGKHEDILKTSPTYKKLYNMQFNNEGHNVSFEEEKN